MALAAWTVFANVRELKTYLGISLDDATDDGLLEQLADTAVARLEGYCGCFFIQRSTAYSFEGSEWPWSNPRPFNLRRRVVKDVRLKKPIVSVTSIVDPKGNSIPEREYAILKPRGILRHVGAWPIAVDSNDNLSTWTVTYTTGYFTSAALVNPRVKEAAGMLVATRMTKRGAQIQSKTVGDVSVGWSIEQSSELPDDVAALVGEWRDVQLV